MASVRVINPDSMPKIFISYRRADAAFVAAIVRDELRSHFGMHSVFLDVDNIPLGHNFSTHINGVISNCDVVLSLIGDTWLDTALPSGQRRIDSLDDPVRIEIETALARKIPIIPVLLQPAVMPAESTLPKSLASLATRNAAPLRSGKDLRTDLKELVRGIEKLLRSQSGYDLPFRTMSTVTYGDEIHLILRIRYRKTFSRAVWEYYRQYDPRGKPLLLVILCLGWGLFYFSPTSIRKWVYPVITTCGLLISMVCISLWQDSWMGIAAFCLTFLTILAAWTDQYHSARRMSESNAVSA